MKEASFKCQYPLTCAMLEFADLAIDVDPDAGIFSATFQRAVPPFLTFTIGSSGRFAISARHIASAVVMTSEQVP